MPNCKECKSERKHNAQSVSFLVHEADMARMERSNKRLWIVILVLIVALLGTNLAWSIYESQFEDVVVTQENEDGYNNFIGNDGDIYNGEADYKNP